MSFKTQIEDLIGSVGDDDLISTSIQDIGAEIIDVLPVEKLLQVAKTTAITSSGLTTAGKKVLAVDKGDLAAREIPAIQKAKFNDTTSIYAASDTDPVYYLEDEKVYVNGAAGSGATSGHLHYVPKIPTTDGSTAIVHGSSTVVNFPQEAERLLVLGGSVRCLQRLMADKTASLPSDISAPSLPVSPSTPSAPSFTYTNASVSDITQPLISISDMASLTESAPNYVPPVLTLGAVPVISNLSISAVAPIAPALTSNSVSFSATAPSYTQPITALSSAPTISDLSITAIAPVAPALTNNSVTFSTTAPVYTPPVASPSFSTVDTFISTDEDVELASAKIQEINAQIGEYQANIQNQLNVFNDANVEYQAELQKAIKNADLSQADDSQLMQKYQADLQSYQAQISKEVQEYQQNMEGDLRVWQAERQTDLQKYSSDIQNNLNKFNEENVAYQANLQVSIQDAQLSQSDDSQKLQKYSNELQSYQAEIGKEVQEYQQNLEADLRAWQAERQTDIQKYNSDIQNALNSFNKENVVYQQDIQRKNQNFQKEIQSAIQNAQQQFTSQKANLDKDVQLNLQNAINNFQENVQEYQATLDRYRSELQDYQAEVGAVLQKYGADVQNYNAKIQKHSIDYQWKQGQYGQLKAEYNQALQILIRGDMPQQQGGS